MSTHFNKTGFQDILSVYTKKIYNSIINMFSCKNILFLLM